MQRRDCPPDGRTTPGDGQIAEGVYVAFNYVTDTKRLVYIWMGTKDCGPMLQYTEGEGWTPIYSRGDYGRNYSHGGHWSGHCRNLLTSRLIGTPGPGDTVGEVIVLPDNRLMNAPPGVSGEITMTELDCSGSWPVWFNTARDAINDMLTADEIQQSTLPPKTKAHLQPEKYERAQGHLRETVTAFSL